MVNIFLIYELTQSFKCISICIVIYHDMMILLIIVLLRDDEWGPNQTQTEEPAITEEDLELIKERETIIKQLEV